MLTVAQSVSDDMAKHYVNTVLSRIVKPLKNIKLTLRKMNGSDVFNYSYYSILFIDSYESLRKIDPGPQTLNQNFGEFYLVIFYTKGKYHQLELQRMFEYFWKYYIINVDILLAIPEHPFKLFTYYPFTKRGCHRPEMVLLNKIKSISNLTFNELFPNKLTDFYGCTILAALWHVPPYISLPQRGRNISQITGLEGFLLKVLAKHLNFRLDYRIPPNNEQRGLWKPDGSLSGALKMLHDRAADLSLGSFRCTLERSTFCSASKSFYQSPQIFAVLSYRQPWSSYEIILYPFDFYIWTIFMISTLALLVSTYILKYFHKSLLLFLYDCKSSSVINISIVALTLGQPGYIEAQHNFARFVLTMWVLLTTVLRSTYQGAMFDFLHSQKTMNFPQTARDLIDRKYTLIVNLPTGIALSGVPYIRNKELKMIADGTPEDAAYFFLSANLGKRYVGASPLDFLFDHIKRYGKYGEFHVLPETIIPNQLCVYFTKHSYMLATFNIILENLRNFGLIDYWARKEMGERVMEAVNERVSGGIPLTWKQLSSVFEICAFLYVMAGVLLCGEILWFRWKLKRKYF